MEKIHHDMEDCVLTKTTNKTWKTKSRSSAAQMNAMISYMTNGAQSDKDEFDFSSETRELGDEDWDQLAKMLNKIGPAYKTVSTWKVSWRDLKRKVRMKMVRKMALTAPVKKFVNDGVIAEIDSPDGNWLDVQETEESEPWTKINTEYANRKMRSSNAQISAMVDFMAGNKKLARGEYSTHAEWQKEDQEWAQLATLLNSMGPAVKNVPSWKVTWRDLKRTAQRKKPLKSLVAAAVAEKIEDIMTAKEGDEPEENTNKTTEDCNDRSSSPAQVISVPHSSAGSDPRASPSELDSPEVTEESDSDSSPCTSPTPEQNDSGGNAKPRSTSEQVQALVDCMAINPCMAFGSQDSPAKLEDWKHLRQLLNRLGPPRRTAEWQRKWRHLRIKSVLDSKSRAKHGKKIPEITKKILEIVEAHKERQQTEPDEESVTESAERPELTDDMLGLYRPSPRIPLTLPDLEQDHSNGISAKRTRQDSRKHSPIQEVSNRPSQTRHTGQVSPVRRGLSQVSPERPNCGQDSSEHISDRESDTELKSTRPKTSKNEGIVRCSKPQTNALVSYMYNHPALAKAYSGLAEDGYAQWRQLTKYLNKMGPAKSTSGWKRTWQYLKHNARRKERQTSGINRIIVGILDGKLAADNHPAETDVETVEELEPQSRTNDPRTLSSPSPPRALTSRAKSSCTLSPKTHSLSQMFSSSKIRSSNTQIEALVNYISKHPELESNYTEVDRFDPKLAEWQLLASYLNKLGTAQKDTLSWKRTWRDLKTSVRRNRRTSSSWNAKISRKVQEIIDSAKTNSGPNQPNVETAEEFDELPCPTDGKPVLCLRSPSNKQATPEVKQDPILSDPLNCDQDRSDDVVSRDCQDFGEHEPEQGSSKHITKQVIIVRQKRDYEQDRSGVVVSRDCQDFAEHEPKPGSSNEPRQVITLRQRSHDQVSSIESTSRQTITVQLGPDQGDIVGKRSGQISTVKTGQVSPERRNFSQVPERYNFGQDSPVQDYSQISSERSCSSEGSEPDNSGTLIPVQLPRAKDSLVRCGDKLYSMSRQRIKTRKTRCTNIQLRALTDYMLAHPALTKDPHSKHGVTEWRLLARHLNRMGNAKCASSWKRTWRDVKKAVRMGKSSGGLDEVRERRVRELLDLRSADHDGNAERSTEISIETSAVTTPRSSSPALTQHFVEIPPKSTAIDRRFEKRKVKTDNSNPAIETNSLLKLLINELKRSNELKAEQNCYMRQFLKQVNTPTLPRQYTDRLIKSDANNDTPVVIQKQDVEDTPMEEDYTDHIESKFSTGFCVNNSVHEDTPSLVKPVSLMTATTPKQSGKQAVNLKTVSRFTRDAMQTMPKVVVRLKDGTMVLMSGSKRQA